MKIKLSDEMKLGTLAYWRYCRQHIMGAIECENADVLTVTKALMLTETEVKTSIADMQRERTTKFYKHRRMVFGGETIFNCPVAHYFYFIVPAELKEKALRVCEERYSYAGLLIYNNGAGDIYSHDNICAVSYTHLTLPTTPYV